MFKRLAAVTVAVAVFAAACSSGSTSTQNVQGATNAPASQAANGSFTLMAAPAGGKTVLISGTNQMTLYTFTKDSANSGKSACNGGCLAVWPALTIASGAQATAGPNCHGKVGTITRDDGTIQVTYNGLPLYFYAKDTKPGDTLGSYPNWNLVTP